MNPMMNVAIAPRPYPRFSGVHDQNPDGLEKILARERETYHTALQALEAGFIHEPALQKKPEPHPEDMAQGKGMTGILLSWTALLLGAAGTSAMFANANLETAKASHIPAEWTTYYHQNAHANFVFSAIMAVCGLATGGLAGSEYLKLRRTLKAAGKQAQDLAQNRLQLERSDDPIEKRKVNLLESWMTKDAETLSSLIGRIYETEPESREHLDRLYGGKNSLPSAIQLQNLFSYYAYQALLAERLPSDIKPGVPYHVSQRALLEKSALLLKAALETGELFSFVEPDQKGAFGQSFNKLVAARLEHLERHLADRLESATGLIRQSHETDQHIRLAQQALVTARLARSMGEEKVSENKGIIERFKGHQQRVETALEKLLAVDSMDAPLLAGLNEEFDQLVEHLQLMLAVQDLTAAEQQENEALQALAAQTLQQVQDCL